MKSTNLYNLFTPPPLCLIVILPWLFLPAFLFINLVKDFSGSVFEGKFLDYEATAILAETPTKEESYAKFIATLRHGPKGIHSMLTHGLRGITLSLKEADKYASA